MIERPTEAIQNTQNAQLEILRVDTVRVLIENVPAEMKSTIINKADAHDKTPLHLAAASQFSDSVISLVRLLLDVGASVNSQDSVSRTPLRYAAMNPIGASITKHLINAGAFV